MVLVEIRMILDLIADQRRGTFCHSLLDQPHREIRHADVPRQTEFLGLYKPAQRLLQRYMRIGPMQQQEIDFGHPKPDKAVLGRSQQIVGCEMVGPDLGGYEHIAALDAGRAHAVADFTLILVNLRRIDMTIAEPNCLLDDARAGAAAQFPSPQAYRWDVGAIRLDGQHLMPRLFACLTILRGHHEPRGS